MSERVILAYSDGHLGGDQLARRPAVVVAAIDPGETGEHMDVATAAGAGLRRR